MKATIRIETNYGFCHNWILSIIFSDGLSKAFYLGQDVKFCKRILGVETRYVVEKIGTNNLGDKGAKEKLANFIIDTLELDEERLQELEPWELCCH